MNVSIRMIGIATTFFWVFLIAFTATAAYSAKDIQFSFGSPTTGMTSDGQILFSMPITVANRGIYNVGSFNVTSRITDKDDYELTRGTTFIPVIRKGEQATAFHNLTINAQDLLARDKNYLFNDTEFTIHESVGLSLAQAIPVQASTNFTMPWGAPLYNFALGAPQYALVGFTQMRVTVPISFENHAFFDLVGTVQLRMYDGAGTLIGNGETAINAPQNSPYSGSVDFYMSLTPTTSGRFEATIQTQYFTYGPVVITYG